ncbi:ER protein Pkr1-domain-containing protein [Pisolithus orientalis]|uniref:ER protein Pkr1-domain-containing protein n=1 Tax=Pisolithus orientalis TaxID=936130 RepID=UPI002224E2E4|nr:ER protein Pkr1-domain-containing protein [Pisolithus orientalis]KAI6035226.1 ER protein Pkr1-domain-containing protein [Pisolithus orientalis]
MMATTECESAPVGFFAFVLKPGSSLHPAFLLAVDCCFAALFFVLVWLAYLTKGNVHFFILLFIELLLWASVKWFVQELRRLSSQVTEKKHQ